METIMTTAILILTSVVSSIGVWAIYRSAYKTGWKHGFITGRDQGRYDGYPIDENESK